MASRGKMLGELALKKATRQQDDQTVAVKANIKVRKDNILGLDVSITMPVNVTVTEIIKSILGSTADESRPAQAAMADLKADMPATAYEQDSEINMNEGSINSDIDETLATSIAGQNPKNYYNDNSVTVFETVTVSTLTNSSRKSRPVDVRSNMSAIAIRDSEIDVDKGSSDRDIEKTPAKPAAEECYHNHEDDYDNRYMNEVPQQ